MPHSSLITTASHINRSFVSFVVIAQLLSLNLLQTSALKLSGINGLFGPFGPINATLSSLSRGAGRIAASNADAHDAASVDVDLALTHVVTPTQAQPGQVITYTLTIANLSLVTATHVVVTDVVPTAVDLITVTSDVALASITPTLGLSYSWALGDLAPGVTAVITLNAILSSTEMGTEAGLIFTNTAEVASDAVESIMDNNTASASVRIVFESPPCSPTVTNTQFEGSGSLRAAIACARPGETVTFTPTLAGTVIPVTQTIVLTRLLTIDGSDAPGVRLSGADMSRIFQIDADAQIELINLVLEHGSAASGGCIYNAGALLLAFNVVRHCQATEGNGGAIYSQGDLIIEASEFYSNSATANGGGVYAAAGLLLEDTALRSNAAGDSGGAVWVDGIAEMADAHFLENVAQQAGGAIYAQTAMSLVNTTVLSNTAHHLQGGGVYAFGDVCISDSLFRNNQALDTTLGFGGAIYAGGSGCISATRVISNAAGNSGGGLFLGNSGRIVNTLLARNQARMAGAAVSIYDGVVTILHTTVADLALNPRAAIVVANGTVSVTNSLITHHAVGIQRDGGSVTEDYIYFTGNTRNVSGTLTSGIHHPTAEGVFLDPAQDDYRLGPRHPALDAGLDAGVDTDIDGAPRPHSQGFDLGYAEAQIVVDVAIEAIASTHHLSSTGIISYSYRITNTGDVTLVVQLVDGRLGPIPLSINGGTSTVTSPLQLVAGGVATGVADYQITRCTPPGTLAQTVVVTGTLPARQTEPTQTLTASANLSVAISTGDMVLAPQPVQSNTLYIGCNLSLTSGSNQSRQSLADSRFQVIAFTNAAPDLMVVGAQSKLPYHSFTTLVTVTNQLVIEDCPDRVACNTIERLLFIADDKFLSQTIRDVRAVSAVFLPVLISEATPL